MIADPWSIGKRKTINTRVKGGD